MKTDGFSFKDLAYLIMTNAYLVHASCLVGNPAPVVEARYRRITNPTPGDLVVETSLLRNWETEPLNSIGRLIQVTQEPINHIEWEDEEKPLVEYWYIETLDGRLFRWHNASFIVASEDIFDSLSQKRADVDFHTPQQIKDAWIEDAKRRHGL